MGRRTLLLITSILLAAVGTALIAVYVKGADSRARQGQDLISVYVVKSQIAANTPVSNAIASTGFALDKRVRSDVPNPYVSNLTSIKNMVTTSTLLVGQVLQPGMFGQSAATTSGAIGVSKGNVGGAFELSDPERVAGTLEPGMDVMVFSVPDKGDASVLLPNVKVIKIGNAGTSTAADTSGSSGSGSSGSSGSSNSSDSANSANTDDVPRTIITFDLSSKQMAKMLTAQTAGELALGVLTGDSGS